MRLVVLVAIALLLSACAGSTPPAATPTKSTPGVAITPQSSRMPASPTPAAKPTASGPPASSPVAPARATYPDKVTSAVVFVAVAEVVDGDTIKVNLNGKLESIRIIGLDTPEVVDPRKTVQCFGREASAKAHELLDRQQVRLVADPTQDNRDKYDRLLRYVEKADGSDFGLTMIAAGYAHEYTYGAPYQRQAQYKTAHVEAREKALGLWAPSTCNGDTTQAAQQSADAKQAPPAPQSTSPVAPVPVAPQATTATPAATDQPAVAPAGSTSTPTATSMKPASTPRSAAPTATQPPAPTSTATRIAATPTVAPTSMNQAAAPTATQAASRAGCDPSYPDVCIKSPPPDLDCKDVPYKRFRVLPPDPHRFDNDKDGIGCES